MVPLWLLLVVLVVEVAALVVIGLTYLAADLRNARRDRRLGRARGRLRDAMGALLDGAPTSRVRRVLRRLSREEQAVVLAEYAVSIDSGRLTEVARDAGLLRRAQRWLDHGRWHRRLRGLRVLDMLDHGERLPRRLLVDPHPVVRAQATGMLDARSGSTTVDDLVSLLADPDRRVRFAAKDALVRGGRVVVGALDRALRSGSADTRALAEALEVARALGDPAFLEAARSLATHPDPRVRRGAVSLLGVVTGPRAVEVLAATLADTEAVIRAQAVEGLGRALARQHSTAIAALLDDPDWRVRRAAASALRLLGPIGVLLLRAARTSGAPRAAAIAAFTLADMERVA